MSDTPEKKEYILGEFHRNWIGYRPEIKLLDCTIRDGGLMNDHLFGDEIIKAVYQACIDAGIDYMELGYKSNKKIYSPDKFGKWKFCDEEDIRRIIGDNDSDLKLSVMADAERTNYHEDILPKEDSIIDIVRVATYINQIPTAIDMIKDAKDKGYECSCNLMAVSTVQESLIRSALDALMETPVDAIFIVDSFGSLYGEQIRELTTL